MNTRNTYSTRKRDRARDIQYRLRAHVLPQHVHRDMLEFIYDMVDGNHGFLLNGHALWYPDAKRTLDAASIAVCLLKQDRDEFFADPSGASCYPDYVAGHRIAQILRAQGVPA